MQFRYAQHDNIDAEHKAIFEAIFDCSKNPSDAALITKLYKVTEDHFVDEEVTMLSCWTMLFYCVFLKCL